MELAKNKRAYFDYDILDTIEAALVLSGQEVKSAKQGQISLKGTHLNFHDDLPGILNMTISKYKPAGSLPDYDPNRWRQLLLHKRQIAYLKEKLAQKGLTIIPLRVYTKGRLIKVAIGIAKGKKRHDKRDVLKQRDQAKEMGRTLKNYK